MPPTERNEEFWSDFLNHPDSLMATGRRFFSRLPAEPRCRLCAAPFAGGGGMVMRVIGKRQSSSNPNFCNSCEKMLIKHHGGAEVEGSMLFADIRGSTALAEKMTPTEFRGLLDRFYSAASRVVFAHDGMVDKFVGDELVATFPPMLSAERHAERAVATAQDLLRATGHEDLGGPWVPIGAGVHTGRSWFGAVGDGEHVEITIVGDPMNVTARLAARAEAGEILVSAEAAKKAGLDPSLPRQSLQLKGRQEPIEVVSLRIGRVSGNRPSSGYHWGPNEVSNMSHIEEEKVTQTTTYERVDDPPKEQVKNVNVNVNTDNDGETVSIDEPADETTDESKPQVNVNISR